MLSPNIKHAKAVATNGTHDISITFTHYPVLLLSSQSSVLSAFSPVFSASLQSCPAALTNTNTPNDQIHSIFSNPLPKMA